jgi:hypothetical protein
MQTGSRRIRARSRARSNQEQTIRRRRDSKLKRNRNVIGFGVLLLSATSGTPALAQPARIMPAGLTVLTFVNRLVINPSQIQVFGYFPTIHGLPDPLFSGTPGEGTAYFTWSLDAAGAVQIQNGDTTAAGSAGVAVLPSGHSLNVYFNATPGQSWNNPGSFSAGQLVATFRSTTGTQTGSGPVALVTQSYVLISSTKFTFKGETYDFARLLPNGMTFIALSGNIPLGNTTPPSPPLIFPAAGSAIAIGGALSGLPALF